MGQYVVFGVVTGGFLLLATLGFALVSRVEKFLNIAHAELLSVAAFLNWWLAERIELPFLVAAAIAIAVTALLGLATARLFYDPIIHRGPAILLITSVGVVFLLQGIIEVIFTPGIRSLQLPALSSWQLGPLRLHPYHAAVVIVALASFAALHVFLTRTKTGIAIRAITVDRELAQVRGIDVTRTTRYVWLIASALAGMAGVALGVVGTLTPGIAFEQILLILSVSILAGLGSLYGLLAAAFILGIAMDLSVLFLPGGYRTAVAFLAIIAVLVLRPQGLAGKARV